MLGCEGELIIQDLTPDALLHDRKQNYQGLHVKLIIQDLTPDVTP